MRSDDFIKRSMPDNNHPGNASFFFIETKKVRRFNKAEVKETSIDARQIPDIEAPETGCGERNFTVNVRWFRRWAN